MRRSSLSESSWMTFSQRSQRAYKREWARMERAGVCGTPGGTLLLPFRLQTARDVLALLGGTDWRRASRL